MRIASLRFTSLATSLAISLSRALPTSLIALVFALPLVLVACGDDKKDADAEPFATLQDCFDEHHVEESLSVLEALVVCCVDHPINGVHPSCGATKAECVTHIGAEIEPAPTADEIDATCADYIDKK